MAEILMHGASYDGIPFAALVADGTFSNALIKTTYPYRKGQSIKNLGRLGERVEVTAVFAADFNGRGPYPHDYWPNGWLRLKKALQSGKRAKLDHPLFGPMWAQCPGGTYSVDSSTEETLRVRLSFEEDNLDEPTFDQAFAESTVTIDTGEARAAALDAQFAALYPYLPAADVNVFGALWAALVVILLESDDVVNYDDVVVGLNTFTMGVVGIQVDFPLISDPINWQMQLEIGLLRRDATVLAQRYAGEERRIIIYKNRVTRSALEIVVDIYGDGDREAEFLRLNDICDPLFVPPGSYRAYAY